MLLSKLDGYLAGILVCPDLIMPGEWLPPIWGSGDEEEGAPAFETLDEALALNAGSITHCSETGDCNMKLECRHHQGELTLTARPAEAVACFEPVLGWFTEGLETRELKEAGALLTSLQ